MQSPEHCAAHRMNVLAFDAAAAVAACHFPRAARGVEVLDVFALEAALVTGKAAPERIRPHLQALLDEAPISLLAKVVDEIHTEKGMERAQVWAQMRRLAHELQCFRLLWR